MNFPKLTVLLLILSGLNLSAQTDSSIKVDINSDNPKFPFPQFQSYKNPTTTLGNLGTKNSVGVSHAEMEKTIRDAYQIMMNRAFKPGGGVGGKDYIKFKSTPDCSEGDGYAMLGAAAMCDKTTFDGLWLWIHDFAMNKVKKYSDCQESSPGYAYSRLPGWQNVAGTNSAADGDFDIGFALLIAYYQWGEFMGINDACGNPISYKKEAIEFLKGLTDTLVYNVNGTNYVCGDIGLDGYFKGGDSWQELTDWATSTARSGFPRRPESVGPNAQYVDYMAPAYFHAMAELLANENASAYAWNIKQFQRGEASSDWLMGQLFSSNPAAIPNAGHVEMSTDGKPVFTNVGEGEDFRLAFRTIINFIWNGNPTSTWDPVTHQVKAATPNSFENDMGQRFAKFLWDQRQSPWSNSCIQSKDKLSTYWGPEVILNSYTLLGKATGSFFLNWIPGVGSPSSVISQDYKLMAALYRYLEIEWDVDTPGDGYITSVPHYFHEWFRLFGLLVLSGNYQAPSELKPTANVKVYMGISKTFAFEGDTATYTIDYRNYGSLDASNVIIVDTLHNDFVFVSATGAGTFNAASHTVTWNIGTLPGFKTSTGVNPTKGQVKLTIKVGTANQKQYRNKATISCSNGTGWTSNEYPNEITAVMKRNYLDIAKRALVIHKSASVTGINPGKEVQFTINFENTSDAGWINGGRSGVHLGFSSSQNGNPGTMNTMRVRLFHDADEAYIDYGNYRISYFLFNAGLTCYQGTNGCTTGWQVMPTIVEGVEKTALKILQQNISPGQDSYGKWNQRIIVQFGDPENPSRVEQLATIDHHLSEYYGIKGRIHRGGTSPLRLVWFLNPSTWANVNWNEDWSYDSKAIDVDGGKYWPVTNDWTDLDNPDIPVTTWNPKDCSVASHTVKNVLVEEWDGYTWRRVLGNGPVPGRDVENVIITDTIPAGLTFSRFIGKSPLGVAPAVNGNIVTWTIPKMQVKQKDSIQYIATASGSCPMQKKNIMTRAWASADKESATSDSVAITVTCDSVPPPPPSSTTMYKRTDKSIYKVGDTIQYTIAYKQTQGSISADASTSYGVNGTFGGTITPGTYTKYSLIARDSIEIRIFNDALDLSINFFNNGIQVGSEQRFTYTGRPGAFNFKIRLAADTLNFWAGDTSALLPNVTQTGFPVRAGYAGIKAGNDPGWKLTGWNSHFDVAYDVVIKDAIPAGLSYVPGSGGGVIETGSLKGTQIVPTVNNNVLTWQVVSGNTRLNYGDSVRVWWKALYSERKTDTIVNTAFTNLRGYPIDKIGAQVKTPSQAQLGAPDHIDIVLDSAGIDPSHDSYIDPIYLDAANPNYQLYAVVRDKDGNFIRKANAVWTSSDPKIATTSAAVSWAGTVTKVGSGTITVYADETGLKRDSVVVMVAQPPQWPVISSAKMLDTNADIIPDMLSLTLNDTFKLGQHLDSISINYKGKTYSVSADKAVLSGTVLKVLFSSLSGTDAQPSGTVTVILTSDNAVKRNSKAFTDGVGPALQSALLHSNSAGSPDTMILTFSELIKTASLTGSTLLLIKQGAADAVPLEISNVIGQDAYAQKVTVLVKGTVRPSENDQLRLVPGGSANAVLDIADNPPHLLNKPVVITSRPPQITSAWYSDVNADGTVESVFFKFQKSVRISDLDISLDWNGTKVNHLSLPDFSYLTDSTTVKVSLPDSCMKKNVLITSGIMQGLVKYQSYPDENMTPEIADSAAPVITKAVIYPDISGNMQVNDTLRVTFSEKFRIADMTSPFFLNRVSSAPTYMALTSLKTDDSSATFLVTNYGTIEYPKTGDSIWIVPQNKVCDITSFFQNNEKNRRALLSVDFSGLKWKVSLGPNPFDQSLGQTLKISLNPSGVKRPVLVDATITIYDAVGNIIIPKTVLSAGNFQWNGKNRDGRFVGSGTYMAIIEIMGDKKEIKRVMIGVKR
jgi:uncharacterized repeat protein (TIGR01451 family)